MWKLIRHLWFSVVLGLLMATSAFALEGPRPMSTVSVSAPTIFDGSSVLCPVGDCSATLCRVPCNSQGPLPHSVVIPVADGAQEVHPLPHDQRVVGVTTSPEPHPPRFPL